MFWGDYNAKNLTFLNDFNREENKHKFEKDQFEEWYRSYLEPVFKVPFMCQPYIKTPDLTYCETWYVIEYSVKRKSKDSGEY